MTFVQAGTYIFKTTGAGSEEITVDSATVELLGGVYHLVSVKDYASFDPANVTAKQVPLGTMAITIA